VKIKKLLSSKGALLVFLTCICAAFIFVTSCQTPEEGGTDTPTGDGYSTTPGNGYENGGEVSGEPEAAAHVFPEANFGGEDFVILNNEPIWDFTTAIVPEEQDGTVLNDAKWRRNMTINEHFNVELVELTRHIGDINGMVRTAVRSGSQDFDAVFCPGSMGGNTIGTLVAGGYLIDLMQVDGLNLTLPWWNQKALEDARIGSHSAIFFASNDISIHALQCPWVIYFNTEMIENLGLDSPYQLVHENRWNLDTMEEYMRAAVSLNGDAAFTPFSGTGSAIYGLSTAIPAIGELFRGLDVRYVDTDSDNMPIFVADSPRFMQAAQRLAEVLSPPGHHTNGVPVLHYEQVFMQGRSLFVYAEFKAASVYRYSDLAFGIVPSPKLDANQESFVHNLTQEAPVYIIPVTTPNLDKTAIIIDAMSYLSRRDVTPVFFDVHMSQKELRTEESTQMLQIIRDTSIFDIGRIYAWSFDINQAIFNNIIAGGGEIASIVEAHRDRVNLAIEGTINALEELESR